MITTRGLALGVVAGFSAIGTSNFAAFRVSEQGVVLKKPPPRRSGRGCQGRNLKMKKYQECLAVGSCADKDSKRSSRSPLKKAIAAACSVDNKHVASSRTLSCMAADAGRASRSAKGRRWDATGSKDIHVAEEWVQVMKKKKKK